MIVVAVVAAATSAKAAEDLTLLGVAEAVLVEVNSDSAHSWPCPVCKRAVPVFPIRAFLSQ